MKFIYNFFISESGLVNLWDLRQTKKEISSMKSHENSPVRACDFSPRKRLISIYLILKFLLPGG